MQWRHRPGRHRPLPSQPLQLQRHRQPPTAQAPTESSTSAAPAPKSFDPQKQTKSDPFSYADWTWLNGTSRNEDTPLATKYFTPEVRFDTNYIESYNQPKDHTMGGSTESFRSGEVQLEQMSFGGDIHVDNVRGRVLTMAGLFATTTPRNDGSAGVGQWNLNDAYKYFSEAWGGYHFNVNHGLNIDAGIFVSYIGLFSYYNFDNWTYQPSFVSSNTPWFFNGVRIQWFPTEKLKIEPWFINGWQSYAKYNGHPGLGGQILWRPTPYLSFVFNNYGMGTDTLGVPGRSRLHTDDSAEVRYFNRPDSYGLDKMAFSVTGDLGCEYGGSAPGTVVSCHNDSHGHPKQMFAGWMLYNRFWFHKDLLRCHARRRRTRQSWPLSDVASADQRRNSSFGIALFPSLPRKRLQRLGQHGHVRLHAQRSSSRSELSRDIATRMFLTGRAVAESRHRAATSRPWRTTVAPVLAQATSARTDQHPLWLLCRSRIIQGRGLQSTMPKEQSLRRARASTRVRPLAVLGLGVSGNPICAGASGRAPSPSWSSGESLVERKYMDGAGVAIDSGVVRKSSGIFRWAGILRRPYALLTHFVDAPASNRPSQ